MRLWSTSFLVFALGWSSTIVVHAAPYPAQPDHETATNGSTPGSNRAATESHSGQIIQREDKPSWLLSRLSDLLTQEDKRVFSSELKDLKLGSRLSLVDPADNNGGIWSVKEYKGYHGQASDLLLKVMPNYSAKHPEIKQEQSDSLNFGEVKALKQVGDLVAAGLMKDPGRSLITKLKDKAKSIRKKEANSKSSMLSVVIIKKKQGNTLASMNFYRNAPMATRAKMAQEVKKIMCTTAARIAVEKHVFHGDRNLGNVLVTMNGEKPVSVQLVDWGIAFSVSQDAKMLDVYQHCMETTKFFRDQKWNVRREIMKVVR
ncbi:hypothetical protein GYMLUDRAFT_48200 [Collybiopsis luxurians FD-317 M1]|uniref:Protein kinase domain-containing protein n=1 Tax=Collybiopsis luxurians FD-317 M1 TaxID=944289 RepID=A0A0D0BYT8_9AGAR|nr:hypothetical protein GYMLUDRAFT_48200 [Collybiopsis luxurians FD-317 M1]